MSEAFDMAETSLTSLSDDLKERLSLNCFLGGGGKAQVGEKVCASRN